MVLNLRFDLAKLSDAELALELEAAIALREELYGIAPKYGSIAGLFAHGTFDIPDARGLLRARWAYRLMAGDFWYFKKFATRQRLIDCEIMDLLDETSRRVQRRRTRE